MRWSLCLYLFTRLKNVNKIGCEKYVTGGHCKFNLPLLGLVVTTYE
jgi:hypothetical protein